MNQYAMGVWGLIKKEDMGFTLPHEHLFTYVVNQEGDYKYWVTDIEKIILECNEVKERGVKTICDLTAYGMGRSGLALRAISKETGLNIICATGFYTDEFISNQIRCMSDGQIEELILRECEKGIDYTDVRPGILKMAISKNEITEMERRVGKVLCSVQRKTGMPLYCHLSDGGMGKECLAMFIEEGCIPEKTMIGHIDLTWDTSLMKEVCEKGLCVSLDKFGRENDERRIEMVKELIDEGYLRQIFCDCDFGNPNRLKYFGGKPGLAYLMDEVIPGMERVGITKEEIHQIFVENPSRMYSYLEQE